MQQDLTGYDRSGALFFSHLHRFNVRVIYRFGFADFGSRAI